MPTEEPDPPDVVAPELTEREKEEAQERTSVSATVVHETVRYDGEEELHRPVSALAWSGLAAGMSMGFSLVAMALFRAYLPDRPWRPLVVRLGYPMGFLIVIIARQQLFTENTLTAIIPASRQARPENLCPRDPPLDRRPGRESHWGSPVCLGRCRYAHVSTGSPVCHAGTRQRSR